MNTDHHLRVLTTVADTVSAGAIVASFLGFLPPIAAAAATLWYLVQIWESHTIQKWWRLHKRGRRTTKAPHRKNRAVRRVLKTAEPPAA